MTFAALIYRIEKGARVIKTISGFNPDRQQRNGPI